VVEGLVDMDAPFAPDDAEAERLRLERPASEVAWNDAKGRPWNLTIPPTVYPPREDTDLLARALLNLGPSAGRTAFEIGVGSGALLLQLAADGWGVGGCDVHPYAVAATRNVLAGQGHQTHVVEGDLRDLGVEALERADLILWNTPYLPPVSVDEAHLGPLEEASLSDPVPEGAGHALLARLAMLPDRRGRIAMVVLREDAAFRLQADATKHGWCCVVEGRLEFDDGERLVVVALTKAWPNATHRLVHSTGSTNADLFVGERRVGDSLRAELQTEGRGRRTASWTSSGGDLTASWILHDGPMPMHPHGLMQAACGLATKDALVDLGLVAEEMVVLKWPNDVLINEAHLGKLGGWLIESRQQGKHTRVVAGLGLNLTKGADAVDGTPRSTLIGPEASLLHGALTVRLCARLNQLQTRRGREWLSSEALAAFQASATRLGMNDEDGKPWSPVALDDQGGLCVEGREEPLHDLDAVRWRFWP
jgi:biotin-(acetyl-CoA carboxylase) ligase